MSRIALLPDHVASQVAAGEVVERPASVVKELVENAIDAAATRIEVLIRRGGSSHIRVVDNGSGMDRDDALLCLERHATSKIRCGSDLAAISTLGFRGEALPSIASVSRFRLSTREHDAIEGTEVIINGGKIESVKGSGEAPGTQIEVRQLFYNLPARRKFLRTENTEASHVETQLTLQALGHPEVGFVYVQDDRVVHQLPPGQRLRERIRDLFGAALNAELLEVGPFEKEGVQVHGFIGKAGVSRSTRQQQITFINGRPVENSTVNLGLREGYHTALMKGQYPVTFLFVQMPPADVDVNVHPAKKEVRFRNPPLIRDTLVEAVRRALESDRGEWTRAFTPPTAESPAEPTRPASTPPRPAPPQQPALIPIHEQLALRRDWAEWGPLASPDTVTHPTQPSQQSGKEPAGTSSTETAETAAGEARESIDTSETAQPHHSDRLAPLPTLTPPNQTDGQPASRPGPPRSSMPQPGHTPLPKEQQFRIIGVLGKLYVLMENSEGLVLVDQHAAHERILFEEMRHRMEQQGVPTQRLLLPFTLQVPARDADWMMQNMALLERCGILLEPFGAFTFKIDALPTFLKTDDPPQLIRDIIDELRETSSQTSKLRLGEEMIAKTVCRHAVKANDVLRERELIRLIQDLLACDLPYCCPHGRPTMIQMSYSELEKKFGRKV